MDTDPEGRLADAVRLETALVAVANRAEEAVVDLARLVAVNTSFPPGAGYAAFADVMTALIVPLGFTTEHVVVPEALWHVANGPAHGDRVNLIGARRTGKPVCSLYFHVDTVPPAPGWASDPFVLRRQGQRLFGLGVADMKGAIAAALLALKVAQDEHIELAYDPTLLLCTDEEGGLYPGVRYLAEQGLVAGHVLNLNGMAAPRIWAGCFGTINLLVRLHGQAAHSAQENRAGQGLNAIEGALPLLNALRVLQATVAKRPSTLAPPPHASGPLTAQLTIAAAHGGCAGGQIPAMFEILLSRRYAPEESFEEARAEIEATIREVSKSSPLAVDIDLVGHLVPTADPTGPHWPRWQRALSAGFGYAPDEFRKWGAASSSDFGFVQQTGMREGLLGGLGRPECNLHGANEHTTLADIVALSKSVLAYLAVDFDPSLIPSEVPHRKGEVA
jgi:succinyl-diaminopimelate desuccinylase